MVTQNLFKIGIALLAVIIGLLSSPLSRKYPLFHWLYHIKPSLLGLLPATTPHPWGFTYEQLEKIDLRGQVALVTGGNSGIGYEIAKSLSRLGASVTIACRNPQRCFAAADKIRIDTGSHAISPLIMDVSDLSSVQKAARTWLHNNEGGLDMLFLNAGIFEDRKDGDTELPLSKDGIEKTFATNVVGHHLLYRLLEPALLKSPMARVVSTSSIAGIDWLARKTPIIPSNLKELNAGAPSYINAFLLYGRSKLAQVSWSEALTKKLDNSSTIYVNSAHPGAVFTPMTGGKHLPPWLPQLFINTVSYLEEQLLWSSAEGALTLLYLGVAMNEIREKNIRGKYFHPQSVELGHPYAGDEVLQENVWSLCEELVKTFL